MVQEHLHGYLNLSSHNLHGEDLAELLDLAHDALFNSCHKTRHGAIRVLAESFDHNFRPTALHCVDGHILMDLHIGYENMGNLPAYLGEVRGKHRDNTNYRSIQLS